jgi:alcohol dehydrogenase (cytochrome c)
MLARSLAWQAGRSFYGGSTRQVDGEPGQKVLRAIDVATGAIRWELPQIGPATSWGGVLATAGGLVFAAEDGGALVAVETARGTPLWRFQANVLWKASPMTYVFDGRQYIAIAAGPNIVAFALK